MSDGGTSKIRLVARLPSGTVKRTKIAAVEEDRTISEVVRLALEEWLKRRHNEQIDVDGGKR